MAKKRTSKPGTVTKMPGGFTEAVGPQQLEAAAKSALSMVKTIVQFLPVKGETATKSDINIIDQWFQTAGEDYTTFERLRNPDRLSWPGPGGFHVASPSPKSFPYFQELCKAMARVCETYQWQGISDGSRIPHSMQRYGTALIPPIDAALLHAVAVAGQGLLEDFDPADIDGRHLIAKLTPQQTNDIEYSPPLDKPDFIALRTSNRILENSDSEITRAKRELHAVKEPGTNWRRFRIPLAELRARMWDYPNEWNTPAS